MTLEVDRFNKLRPVDAVDFGPSSPLDSYNDATSNCNELDFGLRAETSSFASSLSITSRLSDRPYEPFKYEHGMLVSSNQPFRSFALPHFVTHMNLWSSLGHTAPPVPSIALSAVLKPLPVTALIVSLRSPG